MFIFVRFVRLDFRKMKCGFYVKKPPETGGFFKQNKLNQPPFIAFSFL